MKFTKKWLSVLLALAMVLCALPVAFAETDQTKDLLLATVSDIHYYPESLAQYKGEAFYTYVRGNNCVYANLGGILDSAFDALAGDARDKGLKYLVVCGDLTVNGEYEGHVELAERFRKFEQESGISVYVINGNHDINNPSAASFTEPDGMRHEARRTSPTDFYNIYYEFGFDEAVSTFSAPDTGKAGALSYALSVDGYRLIMIDAGKYTADATDKERDLQQTGGRITPELLEWVRSQTEAAKEAGETPLAFTHWNASEMNYMHGKVQQGFVLDDGYRLQETLADMGIHYIFSGHQHVSDIDVTYSDAGEPLYSVITPSLTEYPNAFRETAFSADGSGNVKARFEQYDCAVTKSVMPAYGANYPYMYPYRESGFYLQYGSGDPAQYLMWLIKNVADPYLTGIQNTGSVIKYLKDEFGFDVEQKLDDLIMGGFSLEDSEIFTVDNLMSFLNDLDAQIMDTYIYNPVRLWGAVETAVRNLMSVKISSVPCTKFIGTLGFGDASAPGTLGDLFLSAVAYMYLGNEDIKGDAFMQDVLKQCAKPAFVDLLLNSVEKYVLEDLVVDEILANLYVHVNTLFNPSDETGMYVSQYFQFMFRLGTGIAKENMFSVDSPLDFVKKMVNIATYVTYNPSSTSYKFLLESILSTGIVKYGKSVKEVADYLLAAYFPQQNKEAAAEQIGVILTGMVTDDDRDWDVNYDYTGPVEVVPTLEDMQLPSDLTLRADGDTLSLRWLTKYSVTGTDVEIREKESGAAVDAAKIKTETASDVYTGYGANFGSFGILPYTRDINVHTVTVEGLTPGGTYVYRVGDAAKGFWSAEAEFTQPSAGDKSFTVLLLSDYAASTAAAARAFARTLKTAAQAHPDAAFVVLGGSSALNGADDTQFSSVINAAADTLSGLPQIYVPGASDVSDAANMQKHYNFSSADVYNNDKLGAYYSYDLGNAHIAVVNSNDLEVDGTLSYIQVLWLREDMGQSDAKWKIVVMNAPAVSGETENTPLGRQMTDLCEDLNVDILLQTGAKAYYRSHMVKDGEFLPHGDTVIKTIGGKVYRSLTNGGVAVFSGGTAGAAFAQAHPDEERFGTALGQSMPVYTAITFYEDDITLSTYAVSGDGTNLEFDSWALTKAGKQLMLGDIDSDGQVTSADARLALRYAVELQTLSRVQKLAADVDRNRQITSADARAILRHAVDLEKIRPEMLEYYQNDIEKIDF